MTFSVDNENSFGLATTNRDPEFQILVRSYSLPLGSPKSSILKLQKFLSDINIMQLLSPSMKSVLISMLILPSTVTTTGQRAVR